MKILHRCLVVASILALSTACGPSAEKKDKVVPQTEPDKKDKNVPQSEPDQNQKNESNEEAEKPVAVRKVLPDELRIDMSILDGPSISMGPVIPNEITYSLSFRFGVDAKVDLTNIVGTFYLEDATSRIVVSPSLNGCELLDFNTPSFLSGSGSAIITMGARDRVGVTSCEQFFSTAEKEGLSIGFQDVPFKGVGNFKSGVVKRLYLNAAFSHR